MPVVTNTFSGEDANYNKTEYIGLPLTSPAVLSIPAIPQACLKSFHMLYILLYWMLDTMFLIMKKHIVLIYGALNSMLLIMDNTLRFM